MKATDADRRRIIQRANQIRLYVRRPTTTSLWERRHIQQAVCVLRRLGNESDLKLLERAGFNRREYERR